MLLALLNIAFSHEDEFGETNAFHFFHMGKLIFPVWVYWSEIIEHLAIILTVSIGLFICYSKYSKSGKKMVFGLFEWGFVVILISEIFTFFHHFLIYPFGIFNAIVHHGLLFLGILLLVLGLLEIKTKNIGDKV